MVALRGKEIDAFLARPDAGRPIILLYGPDAGLVRERADALIASAVDDPNDPFSLVKLDGDELSAEPSRLVDEAMTVPLFGGRRAIRIRAGSRSFAAGVDTLAEMGVKDCRIVIEAGELRPESPLRKACEKAKTAVAIGCYPDTERDLAKLMDDELRIANLRITQDARAALMSFLGGDRQASRNELRKLTLYGYGKGEITLDDVMAVVADASELKLDPIVDGAFAGRPEIVEKAFAKAIDLRHQSECNSHVGRAAAGGSVAAQSRDCRSMKARMESDVVDNGFPRLHFSRKSLWLRQRCATSSADRAFEGIIAQLGRSRCARHAQAVGTCGHDCTAHADGDRRECEAAGIARHSRPVIARSSCDEAIQGPSTERCLIAALRSD